MTMDLASVHFDWFGFYPGGQMGLYGGMNTCDSTELLWLSPEVTSYWITYSIRFTPHENYDFISFWHYVKSGELGNVSYVAIDNLSPTITVLNGGLVAAQVSEAEIYVGGCAELSAMVSENNYTSVYWSSIPGGFSSAQLNAGTVCPKQNTLYIVHSTDTCGIISTDTVEVKIKKPVIFNLYTLSNSSSEKNFTVFGLNTESELNIYNALGQKIFHATDYKNDFNLLPLPAALYFYQLKTSDRNNYTGKFEVVR